MKRTLSDKRIITISIVSVVILSLLSCFLLCFITYDKIHNGYNVGQNEGIEYTFSNDDMVITALYGDVKISKKVKKILNGIGPSYNKAESITVSENNKYYYSIDNCIFEKETGKLILGCKNSILSRDVNDIDVYAFNGLDSYEKTSLCFKGSIEDWLKNSNYSKNASIYFDEVLFYNQDIDEFEAIKKIDLNYNIDTIYEYAFANFKELSEINISKNIKTIKDYAFLNCVSLTSMYIPQTVSTIGTGILKGCVNIHTLTLPYVINFNGGIGTWIFEATLYTNPSKKLKTIIVLGGMTLPKDSFAFLTEVQTIEIHGDDISIEQYAFRNCRLLRVLKFYNKITYIDERAFYGIKLDELHYVESEDRFKYLFPKDEDGKIKYYPSPNNFYLISK